MKLSKKIMFATGFLTLAFLLLTSPSFVRNSSIIHASLVILFSITLSRLIYVLLIKYIKNFNQQISRVKKNLNKRINFIEKNNEFSSIQKSINDILDITKNEKLAIKNRFETRVQDLKNENSTLRQEVSQSVVEKQKCDGQEKTSCFSQVARYDESTSLPNRIFFNEILNKTISHAKRRHTLFAVLHLSVDYFDKKTNAITEENSEEISKEILGRLSNALRSEDVLAKLEREEFIIMLNDIKKSKFASTVANKLIQACSQPIKLNEKEIVATASIGICIYPNDGDSLEDLLMNANEALYKAKNSGGNAYQFYHHEMDLEAREYLTLESALRKAIHNNEITLYYQPKLSIKKGHIVGVETLMRWEHPTLGLINPSKFIALAEECGLIMQIGEWALREACQRNKLWQDEEYEHITVSVKLSPIQFYHPDISKIISKILVHSGLNPKYLELEIAENTVMDDIMLAFTVLEQLKAVGVQIAIGHFGMGYTSISHLKKLPINCVKIDRDFIRGVPNNPDDSAITSAIIALVQNLGLKVVAEGVETSEQVEFLSAHHCDVIQGYFLSHPVTAQKIQSQLTKLRDEVLI